MDPGCCLFYTQESAKQQPQQQQQQKSSSSNSSNNNSSNNSSSNNSSNSSNSSSNSTTAAATAATAATTGLPLTITQFRIVISANGHAGRLADEGPPREHLADEGHKDGDEGGLDGLGDQRGEQGGVGRQ